MLTTNYPLNDTIPVSSVKEIMEYAVKDAGTRVAVRYRGGGEIKNVTYNQLDKDIKSLGTALCSLVGQDYRASIISKNSYGYIKAYLTVLEGRGVFIPIDKALSDEVKIAIVNESDSDILFYDDYIEEFFMANSDKMPKVKYFIGIDRKEDAGKFLSLDLLAEKGRRFSEAGDTSFTDIEPVTDEVRMITYVLGSSGVRRGVMITEANIIASVLGTMRLCSTYSTGLAVLPFRLIFEAVSDLLVSFHHHSTVCINDSMKNILKGLADFSPEYIYAVPLILEKIYDKINDNYKKQGKGLFLGAKLKTVSALAKVGFDKRNSAFDGIHSLLGGRLKKIICIGTSLRSDVYNFFNSIGITVIRGYGMTECTSLISINRDFAYSKDSMGYPLPDFEISFDCLDALGNGEILVKSPTLMQGYYNKPELTEKVIDANGYYHTGDLGKINANGRLEVVGKKDSAINFGDGKIVYPEQIENIITSIAYVSEAVVFDIKDEKGTKKLAAEVYLYHDKMEKMSQSELYAKVKRDVARATLLLKPYKHISKVYIRAIPFERTASGRLKRQSVIHK